MKNVMSMDSNRTWWMLLKLGLMDKVLQISVKWHRFTKVQWYVVFDDSKNYFDKCVRLLKLLVIVNLKRNLLKVCLFDWLIDSDSANILLFVFFRNRKDQTRHYLCSLTLLIKLSISFLLSFGRQQKTNLVFFLFCSMCLFVCSIVICYWEEKQNSKINIHKKKADELSFGCLLFSKYNYQIFDKLITKSKQNVHHILLFMIIDRKKKRRTLASVHHLLLVVDK